MKQSICARLATGILVVLSVSSAFAFQGPQPFSADFSTTSTTGNVHMTGKTYFAMPKMRMEMNSTGKEQAAGPFGGNMIMIVDGATKTSYMLMPQQHMYMEFHTDQQSPMTQRMPKMQDPATMGDPCMNSAGATCKKVGTETVNGRSCDKWERTDKNSKTTTIWLDQKLRFPIRMVTAEGMTTDYTNIKEGNQDASLFQVPAGYRKIDMSNMGARPPR